MVFVDAPVQMSVHTSRRLRSKVKRNLILPKIPFMPALLFCSVITAVSLLKDASAGNCIIPKARDAWTVRKSLINKTAANHTHWQLYRDKQIPEMKIKHWKLREICHCLATAAFSLGVIFPAFKNGSTGRCTFVCTASVSTREQS